MKRMDLRGSTLEEMSKACQELNLPLFRAKQLFQWVHAKGVRSWNEIKTIGAAEREKLSERFELNPLELLREQRSKDGTRKYLFRLKDGEQIECVLMDYQKDLSRDRRTVCLSTQVGCPVGCAFCATGLGGFKRNLTVGEIIGQVLEITYLMRREDPGFQVTNIVFMGMGEPMLNYEAVLRSIQLLNAGEGQNIGMRRMTISTSGVASKIRQLALDNPQVGLAVSLHAAEDETRNQLVPMNRRFPLTELMEACKEYSEHTHRRITFEVALIAGKTDSQFARALGKLLQGQLGHVNLIPVNPVTEAKMERPEREELLKFAKILESAGIAVSIREERGTDIDAACGQLRRKWESE